MTKLNKPSTSKISGNVQKEIKRNIEKSGYGKNQPVVVHTINVDLRKIFSSLQEVS